MCSADWGSAGLRSPGWAWRDEVGWIAHYLLILSEVGIQGCVWFLCSAPSSLAMHCQSQWTKHSGSSGGVVTTVDYWALLSHIRRDVGVFKLPPSHLCIAVESRNWWQMSSNTFTFAQCLYRPICYGKIGKPKLSSSKQSKKKASGFKWTTCRLATVEIHPLKSPLQSSLHKA